RGRHLFKKNTFTVSTLPRARLEPPCPGKGYAGDCRGRTILAGGHLNHSLRGLKTRAPRKLVANKQCCSLRRTGRSSVGVGDSRDRFEPPRGRRLPFQRYSDAVLDTKVYDFFVECSDFHLVNALIILNPISNAIESHAYFVRSLSH